MPRQVVIFNAWDQLSDERLLSRTQTIGQQIEKVAATTAVTATEFLGPDDAGGWQTSEGKSVDKTAR